MFTIKSIAHATEGSFNPAKAEGFIQGVTTDSRHLRQGELFVALKGDQFDGHHFVLDVLKRGAAAALVERSFSEQDDRLIRVDDTRLALGNLAAWWRQQFQGRLIGVTGSNGKTTVKDMLASIMRHIDGESAVLVTKGNLNNDIGVPLTLLSISSSHRYAIVEMGMNHPGEIRYLTKIARPDAALVNNALRAHLGGGFNQTGDIAQAKAEIFEGLYDDGIAVINADDPHINLFRAAAKGHQQLEFGLQGKDVWAEDIQLYPEYSSFFLCTQCERVSVILNVPGKHNVLNALAAVTAAFALSENRYIALTDMVPGLAGFQSASGRLQYRRMVSGTIIIDDTYNANPDSMKAGLAVLAAYPAPRLFIMGDIGELGEQALALHQEVIDYAVQQDVSVLTLGSISGEAAKHCQSTEIHSFDQLDELMDWIKLIVQPEMTILVKGSRFMKMERVVEKLLS